MAISYGFSSEASHCVSSEASHCVSQSSTGLLIVGGSDDCPGMTRSTRLRLVIGRVGLPPGEIDSIISRYVVCLFECGINYV